MAEKTIRVCDVCPKDAREPAIEAVSFVLDNREGVLDVCREHARPFERVLGAKARKRRPRNDSKGGKGTPRGEGPRESSEEEAP